MQVSPWIWLATIAGIIGLLAFSFFVHMRKPHAPTMRESGVWTAFFVTLSLLFGACLAVLWGPDHGTEFLAGYITEYSLSVDNLFIFVLIMNSFAVPAIHQQRVLLIGIVMALALRTVFILLGGAAIAHFNWMFYLFGLFLIVTAIKLACEKDDQDKPYEPNVMVRMAQKLLPFTDSYDGTRLLTSHNGRRCFTPMTMVMLAIGMTDVLFALDSIPAIYGLTDVPYIVFTANAFALLGLIELYFLLGGLLGRLVYLGFGLALILGFIGIKLIIEAMHVNNIAFLNDGAPIELVPLIPTWLSLVVIVVILALTVIASLLKRN